MALIPIRDDLPVPIAQILWQADGEINQALQIAAAYGYGCACHDLQGRAGQTKLVLRKKEQS